MLPSQLDSPVISNQEFRRRDRAFKQKQKLNHDRHRGARLLKPLKPGDPVAMKLDGEKRWERSGRVRTVHSPRSYIVEADDGGCVRRNRRHLQSRPDTSEAGRGSPGAARIGVGPKHGPVVDAACPADGPNWGFADSHSGDGPDGTLTQPSHTEAARQGVGPNNDVFAAARQAVVPNDGVNDAARPGVGPNGDAPQPHVNPGTPTVPVVPRRSGRAGAGSMPKHLTKDYILN